MNKRSPDCKFAFATLADIERFRLRIGTDPGNLHEPREAIAVRQRRAISFS